MNQKHKKIISVSFMSLLIIYFETVLKATAYETVFNEGYILMCLFSLPAGLIFHLLTSGFTEKTNKIVFMCLVCCLTFYYGAQMMYYKIFSTFASMYFFIGAKKAAQFSGVLVNTAAHNMLSLVAVLLPAVLVVIFYKKISMGKASGKYIARCAASAAVMQAAVILIVISSDEGMLSPSYLYTETFLVEDSIDRFGLLTTGRLDIKNILKNTIVSASGPEPIKAAELNESDKSGGTIPDSRMETAAANKEETAGYNELDIPFDKMAENEGNKDIRSMHEYFRNVQPTEKNKYTGMFKGKNLIMITAESFSPYAVDKDLTPTLYRMYEEGFKFTDFYTPLWGVSTSDGEYVTCTSLLPKEGIWSFYKSSENYMPFCMGNQLKSAGYETYAYHNHYFDYYFRNKSHPNMGYIYKGLGNGLDVKETWPESDIEMIELTADEYMGKQPFHTYYMTVSGHLRYSFAGNYIASKNKQLVENLPYSESVKAYLACSIELDRALEKLIAKLEEKGIADDTVIAISPDHYPYGLTEKEISELAGHDVNSEVELYRGIFLLWSKGMEPVEISKTSSSLDIVPTLSNLMGLDYDSRLLMGSDILSDSEPLVVFRDRSWITDKAYFNSRTGEVVPRNDQDPDESYIKDISERVKQKFKVSAMILDNDYYGIVFSH